MDDLTAEDRLEDVDLPLSIAGCQLIEEPGNKEGGRPLGAVYDIQSRGPLGGEHGTLFRAEGDIAEIIGILPSLDGQHVRDFVRGREGHPLRELRNAA